MEEEYHDNDIVVIVIVNVFVVNFVVKWCTLISNVLRLIFLSSLSMSEHKPALPLTLSLPLSFITLFCYFSSLIIID